MRKCRSGLTKSGGNLGGNQSQVEKGGAFLSTTLKRQIGFNVSSDPRRYSLEHPVGEPLSINGSKLTVRWRDSSYSCALSSTSQIDRWIAENVAAPLI